MRVGSDRRPPRWRSGHGPTASFPCVLPRGGCRFGIPLEQGVVRVCVCVFVCLFVCVCVCLLLFVLVCSLVCCVCLFGVVFVCCVFVFIRSFFVFVCLLRPLAPGRQFQPSASSRFGRLEPSFASQSRHLGGQLACVQAGRSSASAALFSTCLRLLVVSFSS